MEVLQDLGSSPLIDVDSGPWIFFVHDGKTCNTLFSMSKKTSVCRRSKEEMQGYSQYWPTPQGWMLVHHRQPSTRYSLLNPITMATVELPPMTTELPKHSSCVLSSSPTDSACVIMCFAYPRQCLFCCHIYDDTRWTCQECNSIYNIVSSEGKFFAHGWRNFAEINFTPQPEIRTLEELAFVWMVPISGRESATAFLVESQGEMFMVRKHTNKRGGCIVDVAKRDRLRRTWGMVDSIGGRAFFIQDGFIGSCGDASKINGTKGNCIYFLSRSQRSFDVYDMENEATTRYDVCPHLKDPDSMAFWIMPPL